MKTIPTALLAHYQQPLTTIAICWQVALENGDFIRGTEHDLDLVIASDVRVNGTYQSIANITASAMKSAADMSPDNMEVQGAIPTVITNNNDISVDMIESGILDLAVVIIFLVNWADPTMGVEIVKSGRLGNLSRDDDGAYKIEIRGMAQYLSQQIGYTYSTLCNVVTFGDTRCKFDVAGATRVAQVVAITDRKNFVVGIISGGGGGPGGGAPGGGGTGGGGGGFGGGVPPPGPPVPGALDMEPSPDFPDAVEGVAYSQTITGSGGTKPYTWVSSGVPSWATVTISSDTTTWTISGTPPGTTSMNTIVLTITDSA